jgi:hypothetical protein
MSEMTIIQIGREELNQIVTDAVCKALGNQNTTKEPEKSIKGLANLAAFLGISVSTAAKLKKQKIIPCFQTGSLVLFDPIKVREAMANHKIAGKKWTRIDASKVK